MDVQCIRIEWWNMRGISTFCLSIKFDKFRLTINFKKSMHIKFAVSSILRNLYLCVHVSCYNSFVFLFWFWFQHSCLINASFEIFMYFFILFIWIRLNENILRKIISNTSMTYKWMHAIVEVNKFRPNNKQLQFPISFVWVDFVFFFSNR